MGTNPSSEILQFLSTSQIAQIIVSIAIAFTIVSILIRFALDVRKLIIEGSDREDISERAIELADRYQQLYETLLEENTDLKLKIEEKEDGQSKSIPGNS